MNQENPLHQENLHKKSGLRRLVGSFFHSMSGLKMAYTGEAAFRQEVWLSLALLPLLWFLELEPTFKLMLFGSLALVWMVELLNSAVEAVVDLASPEIHPLAKRAKDIASAAVFVSLANLAAFWGLGIYLGGGGILRVLGL